MTTHRSPLLLAHSWFSGSSWDPLIGGIDRVDPDRFTVIAHTPEPLHALEPIINAVDTLDRLRERMPVGPPGVPVWAIAAETGAGPVAQLCRDGTVNAAVLLDPGTLPMAARDPDLARFADPVPNDVLAEMQRRMREFEWPEGEVMPEELIDITEGAFTGEPGRMLRAEHSKVEARRRAPIAPREQSTAEMAERVDWLSPWQEPDLDVEVWLSAPHAAFGEYLAERYPNGVIRQFSWPLYPWLSVPDAVAAELSNWAAQR